MKRKMNIFELFLNNTTTKSVAVSILVGTGGWAAHTLVGAQANATVLAAHTQQLERLWQGQGQASAALQGLGVAITRIDGKLDVVNQKIDDDRAHRTHPPR